MHQQLRDLAAMRLVRRNSEDHLDRSDELAGGERRQQQPVATVDLSCEARERGSRVVVRERRHVADGCAAVDAVHEDTCQRVELFVELAAVEAANLDLTGLVHAGVSRPW